MNRFEQINQVEQFVLILAESLHQCIIRYIPLQNVYKSLNSSVSLFYLQTSDLNEWEKMVREDRKDSGICYRRLCAKACFSRHAPNIRVKAYDGHRSSSLLPLTYECWYVVLQEYMCWTYVKLMCEGLRHQGQLPFLIIFKFYICCLHA